VDAREREKEREREREEKKKSCGAMNCRPCHWPALRAALIVLSKGINKRAYG
jgi:hypothetical protein